MKYALEGLSNPAPSVGHDDDQHTVLFGEDLTALKEIGSMVDGQPTASTEGLKDFSSPKDAFIVQCQDNTPQVPYASRVIDADGHAYVKIYLGEREKSRYLGQIIGLLDTASENDVVDLTIAPNYCGECDTYSCRSILSAINRCKASVITRAGFLTSIGDLVIWLSGDELRWHKGMTGIFIRQLVTGYGGDIADFERKSKDAISSFKEYSDYIAARGLFTTEELNTMYETRGMLSLHGNELETRLAQLKAVEV